MKDPADAFASFRRRKDKLDLATRGMTDAREREVLATGDLTDSEMRFGWHFCQGSDEFRLCRVERAWKCYSCGWEVPGRGGRTQSDDASLKVDGDL